MDSQFDILRELFVEFFVIFGILLNFGEQFHNFFDDVFLNDFEDLVLLQEFSWNIKRKIFRINDSLDEAEAIWDQILAVVHNEDSSDVEFDVIFFLFSFKEVEGGSLGYEEDSLELELSLNGELFYGQMVFPVVGQGFVESGVFFLGDSFGFAHPDWLSFVLYFKFGVHFFNFFFLFILWFLFIFVFDFRVFTFFLFRFFFIIRNFLFGGLFNLQLDFEVDEFRVLFNQIFNLLFL